jgi:hypothetical protein
LKRTCEGKKVSLLFVGNAILISTRLLMVEDGTALMKFWKWEKEDNTIVNERRNKKKWNRWTD